MKSFCSLLSVLLLLSVSITVSAQPVADDEAPRLGMILGTVVDDSNGEPAIGAYVMIRELGIGGVTDLNGNYIVRNIPTGVHVLTVTYVGYRTVTITDLRVNAGDRIQLDFRLQPGSAQLDEVTVTAFRQSATIGSVLLEVQRLNQVVSGVSAQQIARSQDGNAAQVMQRIPGITIVENRFVMIRGLSERYNSVMINNLVAPSTEVDKRTFSFDLISSGSLDRMLIYKSGTADLPGDFAGGVIKLFTIDDVERNFVRVSYGLGYRSGTTGNSYMQSNGSSSDILGFDNGFRRLPSDFPTTRQLQNSPRNSPLRISAAHSLPNNFQPNTESAFADQSLGITFGLTRSSGKRVYSNMTTIIYANAYQSYNRDFTRYLAWVDQTQPILQRFAFTDQNFQKDTRVSVMSNFKVRLNNRSSLSFKNLFNQIGENETILREGRDFIQGPNFARRNYLLGYRSRSIYSGQLEGIHNLTSRTTFNWVAGGSMMREDEPDLRRFRTYLPDDATDGQYRMQLPPSSNLFETGRYFGQMDEFSLNHAAHFTTVFSRYLTNLKTGYQVDYRDRVFQARYLSYLYPGFFDPTIGEELIRLPLNEIFSPENVRNVNGFVIEEGTRPIDRYDASSLTIAEYASMEVPLGRFNLVTGVRLEFNRQQLQTRDDFEDVIIDRDDLAALPFVNSTYSFSDRSQVRFTYGRTINRPEFREIAPFLFYDYKMEAGRIGNPDLKKATIDNADIRMELYPRSGETITFGFFYKYFQNPIENSSTVTTESPQFGYINASYAWSYGFETEIRKSFQGLTGSSVLDRFSLNANASLIFTEVDLGNNAPAQDKKRSLQGQSPYIVNLALYYDDIRRGLTSTIAYNVIGPRIYAVGDVLFPTIIEMPRHSLDITTSARLNSNATVKFGIQDVLNAPYRFYQDSDRNNKIDTSRDHEIFSYARGRNFSVTLSYSL